MKLTYNTETIKLQVHLISATSTRLSHVSALLYHFIGSQRGGQEQEIASHFHIYIFPVS